MLRAVIVGINDYRDARIHNLAWATNDAEELAALIDTGLDEAQRRVTVLVDEHATRSAILTAIGDTLPREEREDDLILLYFACHGSPEHATSPHQAERYLIAHDTDFENIFATAIDMNREVRICLERLTKSKIVIVFLDTCFSGAAGGRTFRGPRLAHEFKVRAGPARIDLSQLQLGEGRVIIAACKDTQTAKERDSLQHGVFTYHLLNLLRTESLDGTISVSRLYQRLVRSVGMETSGTQIPVLNGQLLDTRLPVFPVASVRQPDASDGKSSRALRT